MYHPNITAKFQMTDWHYRDRDDEIHIIHPTTLSIVQVNFGIYVEHHVDGLLFGVNDNDWTIGTSYWKGD